MGCDIHIIAEVKENGKWRQSTDKVFLNPYYRPDETPESDPENWHRDQYQVSPPSNRNYDWFSILADVRNGFGFAKVSTGDGFNIISAPKGIPEDCCDEWREHTEDWSGDMHSHSFLSIEDFDNFDWNQTTIKYGIIPISHYEKIRGTNNTPDSWSGGVMGPNLVTINLKTANDLLDGKITKETAFALFPENIEELMAKGPDVYVQHEWKIKYSEWFKDSLENTVEPLRKLKEKYEDARIVFGFDN